MAAARGGQADPTSHMKITRPLCTLSGPANRSIPDAKMVTECAKCVPAPPGMACGRVVCPVLSSAHESG